MLKNNKKVSQENCEHYLWGVNNECDGWHLAKSKNLSIILEKVPPGSAEQNHYHNKAEQFFFILSGEATIEVGMREIILTAGEGVHISAGTAHRLVNKGHELLTFTVTSTPPSHGDRQLVDSLTS